MGLILPPLVDTLLWAHSYMQVVALEVSLGNVHNALDNKFDECFDALA
jgi:hypothetical protein